MEVSGAGEESVCQVQVVLTDLDCTLDQGDGRTISVSMGLLAQAVVRDTRTLELLTDVYSTAYSLTAERKSCTLRRLAEHGEREAAVREILETGQLAQEVSDAYVTLGAVTQSREGTRLTLAAEAYVTVLYRTEDGACSSVTRQLQAACPLELPEDASCTCLCSCTAPVFATPTAGGIEVRFSLSFSYTALTSRTAAAVAAVQLDESAAADHAGQPSIVLRMVGAGSGCGTLPRPTAPHPGTLSRPTAWRRSWPRRDSCCSSPGNADPCPRPAEPDGGIFAGLSP